MTTQGEAITPAVPGPADPESFFDAQRRHRRTARRYGAATWIGVFLVGGPMSVVVTPAILMIVITLGLLVRLVALAATGTDIFAGLHTPDTSGVQRVAVLAVVLVLPGALAQAIFYGRVRSLFATDGADALVAEIGARPPNAARLDEQTLVNVVAEMAIAARLAPPRVVILDGEVLNAAVVGATPEQATIIVGRRLLTLDRATLQAVVGELVARIGNGDLHIATSTVAARLTTAAVAHAIAAPLGHVARSLWLPARGRDAVTRVGDLLRILREEFTGDDRDHGHLRGFFRAPTLLAVPCYSLASAGLWTLLMKPWQRRFLQARSALADATAVQLTRLADPLAQAVRTISAPSRDEKRNAATIGAEWTTSVSLFASPADDPHGGDQWLRAREPLGLRLHRLGRLGALDTRGATPPRPLGSRLLRGALAAPFVLAWYAIALAAIAFFIYLTLFLTTFMYMLTYGLIILMITLVVTLATHR